MTGHNMSVFHRLDSISAIDMYCGTVSPVTAAYNDIHYAWANGSPPP